MRCCSGRQGILHYRRSLRSREFKLSDHRSQKRAHQCKVKVGVKLILFIVTINKGEKYLYHSYGLVFHILIFLVLFWFYFMNRELKLSLMNDDCLLYCPTAGPRFLFAKTSVRRLLDWKIADWCSIFFFYTYFIWHQQSLCVDSSYLCYLNLSTTDMKPGCTKLHSANCWINYFFFLIRVPISSAPTSYCPNGLFLTGSLSSKQFLFDYDTKTL